MGRVLIFATLVVLLVIVACAYAHESENSLAENPRERRHATTKKPKPTTKKPTRRTTKKPTKKPTPPWWWPTTKKPSATTTTKKPSVTTKPPAVTTRKPIHWPCVGPGWWQWWRRGRNYGHDIEDAVPFPFFFFGWLDLKIYYGCFPHGGTTQTPTTTTTSTTTTTTTTSTTPIPTTTTTACTNLQARANCGNMLDAAVGAGIFAPCIILGNDTVYEIRNRCFDTLCPNYTNVGKCVFFEELVSKCNAALTSSGSADQVNLMWRTTYNCPAATTTAAPTTQAVTTTAPEVTTTTVASTTTACTNLQARANCGNMLDAAVGAGIFAPCIILGNDTVYEIRNRCFDTLCPNYTNVGKCVFFEELVSKCNAALNESGSSDQVNLMWRTTYNCPAPTTTPSPTTAAVTAAATAAADQQMSIQIVPESAAVDTAVVSSTDSAHSNGWGDIANQWRNKYSSS